MWTGHAQDPSIGAIRTIALTGPAVAQMQAAFHGQLDQGTGQVLHGRGLLSRRWRRGTRRAGVQQLAARVERQHGTDVSPGDRRSRARDRLSSARTSCPNDLDRAKRSSPRCTRGTTSRIITPGPHIDSDRAREASRATGVGCSKAGAQMYEYQPTMFHCKVFIVDGLLVSVGSTNSSTPDLSG